MIHSVLVDEEYSVVGGHLDESLINKIKRGEYVDFGKLLPKDRIAVEEDNRLQPIFKEGQIYWQTPSEPGTISNFNRWEKAFRVFAKIYTKYHPQRASELIQYSHDIHAASLTFTWDNVYPYDKEFRLHLSKHTMRSWGVILQHAWNLKMKDRLSLGYHHAQDRTRNSGYSSDNKFDKQVGKKKRECCKCYNRGKCTYGSNCKYEHRCSYCNKFGHGILTCRKLNADKDNKWKNGKEVQLRGRNDETK